MEFELDKFNGIIIDPTTLPAEETDFSQELKTILQFSLQQNKSITWLTLPITSAHFIRYATELGFVFHNCLETEITLIHKQEPSTFVPFVPTHTLGAGAFITSPNNEILMIREHGMTGYKLPGGHIELAESIEEAIVREVYEETGITATFQSILGMATRHPYQFGKSNLYFICSLKAHSYDISIKDTDEIAEAKWIKAEDFLADTSSHLFNHQLVEHLLNKRGLPLIDLDRNQGPYKKDEVFFSDIPIK
ncbi:NUDIX domain-containing protein [Vibrio profundi]|uniref:NUDIX hydrolase n=1 Tax=Vibrio profundi TaxID=1774960 RepID=UPI00373642B2